MGYQTCLLDTVVLLGPGFIGIGNGLSQQQLEAAGS